MLVHINCMVHAGYSQPRHLTVPDAAIQAFHITVNSALLQSALSK